MLTKPTCKTTSLMAVVIDHHHRFKLFIRTKRCKLRSFTHLDFARLELDWTNATAACLLNLPSDTSNSFHRSFSTPCLSTATKVHKNPNTSPRIDVVAGRGVPGIRALVVEASIALASGIEPVAASSGLGGAYYLRNRGGESIAVIKAIVGEPTSALSNPTVGYGGRILGQPDLVRSVRAGETGVREVAAYLLDHDNFVGVPPTALIKVSNLTFHANRAGDAATISPSSRMPKMASIQQFVPHDFDAGELGPSGFSVASVHRIGILDVRLLNIDRHAGNILVKKINRCSFGGYVTEGCTIGIAELVPIDHGLCLPESLDDPYFEWLHWPQASVPFSDSELEYINKLDPFKDAELLQTELPLLRESCIRILVLCTIFLKRAADAGLCLADIGDMMTREFRGTEEEPSVLETLCIQANATLDQVFDFATEGEDEANDGFQFDMDCNEEDHVVYVFNIPHLLRSHHQVTESRLRNSPSRISTARSITEYSHAVLSPLHEGDDYDNDDGDDEDNGNDDNDCKGDEHKVRCLPKSVSFSVMQHNHECNEISFKDMREDEWKLFLERFEELLPNAFESRRNMGLKQRLGTSCKF